MIKKKWFYARFLAARPEVVVIKELIWQDLISSVKVNYRELKQQTFAIHGGQPELKLHKSCALRMSHGRRGLSRRAPMNFSRPCRFATILILHGFLRRQR